MSKEKCEFCELEMSYIVDDIVISLDLEEEFNFEIEQDECSHITSLKINYCPFCGKKL